MFNQWIPQTVPQVGYQQRQEVLRVNGENGAKMLSLAPNSSVLALDEHEPLVWFAQTDGAGYKTVSAYKIEAVATAEQDVLKELSERVARLEVLYGKPDSGADGNGAAE